MRKWSLQTKAIRELKEHPRNPRSLSEHDGKHLRESLDHFGQCEPIVINTDGMIIGGHQRVRVLKDMGITDVDVYTPDEPLSSDEVDELNIRLNRNAGEWDWDCLANEWDMGSLMEWGFTEAELGLDIQTIEEDDEEATDTPEAPKDPITQPGDLYELGPHRLLCGDSTLPESVELLLDSATPILMVTDPPYGVNYDASWRNNVGIGKGDRATGKVSNDDLADWSIAWTLFPGSVAYVWHAGMFAATVEKSLQDAEYDIVSQIIWAKQHFALSRGDYHWQHEPCWYAVRKGHKHNWQGSRKESTVWDIANLNSFGKSQDEDERTNHSTQKPLECMSRPIRNNTEKGEGVYDPFLGSGTTLIAADKLDRICYGMELDPAYCDVIVSRYAKHCRKQGREPDIKRNGEPWEGMDA